MKPRVMLLVLGLTLTAGSVADAQRIAPSNSPLFVLPASAPEPGKYRATYWKEGALITGIPTGILFGAIVYRFCTDPDGGAQENCGLKSVGLGILGAIAGAIPGALIGAMIPKHE